MEYYTVKRPKAENLRLLCIPILDASVYAFQCIISSFLVLKVRKTSLPLTLLLSSFSLALILVFYHAVWIAIQVGYFHELLSQTLPIVQFLPFLEGALQNVVFFLSL